MYVPGRSGTGPGVGPALGLPTGWGNVVRHPSTVGNNPTGTPADLLATISMFEQHIKPEPIGFYAPQIINRHVETNGTINTHQTINAKQLVDVIPSFLNINI